MGHSELQYMAGSWVDANGVVVDRPEQPMHATMWLEDLPLELKEKGKATQVAYKGDFVVMLPGTGRVVMTRSAYEAKYGPQPVSAYWTEKRGDVVRGDAGQRPQRV